MAFNSREAVTPPKELLTEWLARLYRSRLTTTTGGNLSLIDDDGTFYITPSGGDKAIVPPEKIAFRRPGNDTFEGPAPPSMEWPLHCAAYKVRPQARAVLHAHSMALVAFSLARGSERTRKASEDDEYHDYDDEEKDPRVPNTKCLLGAWQACGKVALAAYAIPGSKELADECRKAFSTGANCVILQNHGVVVIGRTMQEAYNRFVSLDYLAQSMVHAVPLKLPLKMISPRVLKFSQNPDENHEDNPFPKSIPDEYTLLEKRNGEDPLHRIMTGEEKVARADLCKYVHRAYKQNLVTSSSGSFSIRINCDKGSVNELSFLVTPTDVDRRTLEPTDICIIHSVDSKQLRYSSLHHPKAPDHLSPSRASRLHATIYEHHPEIKCIMVVQPPYATAYVITGASFDAAGIPESFIVLQHVDTLSLEEAFQDNGRLLARSFDPAKGKTTVLVQGLGVVTVGTNLLKAFVQLEVLESMCGVSLDALSRGPVALLSEDQVSDIQQLFRTSR